MKIHAGYCIARNSLEQRRLRLVGKLSDLSTALTQLIGKNHSTFLATKVQCEQVREELVAVRRQIQNHLIDHRCCQYCS